MSIEDTIDQWTTWIQTKAITYGLITWHWITWAAARGVEFTKKTIRGAREAHSEENWYFLARNECPWPMKIDRLAEQFSTEGMWTPALQRMYFNETTHRGDERIVHTFSDVVTAELYTDNRRIHFDLSSFFHTFSWRSVRVAPSLYEVVLLYCLSNNTVIGKSQLEGCILEVLNAEGETIYVRLNTELATQEFAGWGAYHGGTPSATSSVSE